MVRDLLIGYMPGEWLKDADFNSLSRVNGSYVSERAIKRTPTLITIIWFKFDSASRKWQ